MEMNIDKDIDRRLEIKIIEDLAAHWKSVMKERQISFTDEAEGVSVVFEYLNATEKWITQRPRQVYISTELQEKIYRKQYFTVIRKNIYKKIHLLY